MPNHVLNIVSVEGDPQTIHEMLESVQNDEMQLGSIDFNKIIPMPESMNIEAGSDTDKGFRAYCDFINVYTLAGTREDADLESIPEESEQAFLRMRSEITPRQWQLGKAAYENQSKYGAPTWYEWSINHWGTKWNAYDCSPCEPVDGHAELRFSTAWSAPHPILQRLSEQFPTLVLTHEWAVESIGMNCGMREYRDGSCTEQYQPTGDEATAFSCMLWGIDPEDESESPMLEM